MDGDLSGRRCRLKGCLSVCLSVAVVVVVAAIKSGWITATPESKSARDSISERKGEIDLDPPVYKLSEPSTPSSFSPKRW